MADIDWRKMLENLDLGTGDPNRRPDTKDPLFLPGQSRYYDKPRTATHTPFVDTIRERFADPMDGSKALLGPPPYDRLRADSMTEDAKYARHPDAREAILNTVSGVRTVAPSMMDEAGTLLLRLRALLYGK